MKLTITIDGKVFEVDVEASEPESAAAPARMAGVSISSTPLRDPAPALSARQDGGKPINEDKVCRSPVSGIVVRIAAQVGQTLQPGDILVVLEAMKMETNITAPSAGKIAAIRVNQGDSVPAGQVVVEFE